MIEQRGNRIAADNVGKLSCKLVIEWLLRNLEPLLSAPSVSTIKFVAPSKTTVKAEEKPSVKVEENPFVKVDERLAPVKVEENSDEMTENEEQYIWEEEEDLKRMEKLKIRESTSSSFPLMKTAASFGIQIKLSKLEMNNIGLLCISSLSIVMKCIRCNRSVDFTNVRPDTDRIEKCTKCDKEITCKYFGDSVFPTKEPSFCGVLQSRAAVPIDFMPSTFQILCEVCPPDRKHEPLYFVPSVKPGDAVHYACHWCHSKLSFRFNCIEWIEIQQSAFLKDKKKMEKQKLLLKPGEPLPKNGSCVHYKKSFRWLRFPCCGKAYPCDECHNLENPNHKAEWANRMICGYCSKEQPFSQKLCSCGSALSTASMKTTAFWEGGKGTRNAVSMSKKDAHKYRGMTKAKK